MKTGALLISQERERQQLIYGYGPYQDDMHRSGEMNDAAISYAMAAAKQARGEPLRCLQTMESAGMIPWPWEASYWKPSDDPIRNLVRAGALIAAEIDRLQRITKA